MANDSAVQQQIKTSKEITNVTDFIQQARTILVDFSKQLMSNLNKFNHGSMKIFINLVKDAK